MTVQHLHQQSSAPFIGATKAGQACLPTCFFMLARAHGYLPDISFETFMRDLDWEAAYDNNTGWMRARFSQELRRRYRVPIVSWWINAKHPITPEDQQRMRAAGYLSSQREVTWFERNVADWPLEVLVAAGTPVIATMKAGFGQNKSLHAVILASLKDDRYEVIDPDERNSKRFYTIDQIRRQLSPVGAGSIILPPR